MMLEDQLLEDLKASMKSGNTIKKNTIQLLRANLLLMKKTNPNLTENDILEMLIKEKKKREDALVMYEKANREDLMEQTKKEIGYISAYLPEPISEADLEDGIKQIIEENKATLGDFGKVIRIAREKYITRSTGRLISETVKKLLGE